MSVKITPEIIRALRSLIDEWGSALEIERRIHIANSSISRYLSGRLPRMNDTTWQVLRPHLMKYLPESEMGTETPAASQTEDIFRRVVYDDSLSSDDKIKFLKLIVPPPDTGK